MGLRWWSVTIFFAVYCTSRLCRHFFTAAGCSYLRRLGKGGLSVPSLTIPGNTSIALWLSSYHRIQNHDNTNVRWCCVGTLNNNSTLIQTWLWLSTSHNWECAVLPIGCTSTAIRSPNMPVRSTNAAFDRRTCTFGQWMQHSVTKHCVYWPNGCCRIPYSQYSAFPIKRSWESVMFELKLN